MSMTLLEHMKSSISQQAIGYAAKLLGESPANIEKAVSLGVPAILSAITSAAHTPSGTAGQSVVSRLVSDPVNDGSLLHRLPALYQGTMTAAPVYRLGAQLLQAVFGAKLGKFTQTVAALSGIKPASSALLVNTLAPHILAILGKRHRLCGDATPHGLVNLLDTEHAAMQAALPGALAELIPAPVKVATVDAITAVKSPPVKTVDVKTGSAAKSASAASPAAISTVPKHAPYVKPPLVTKQSYTWSSWLPVIALYGAGAAGLAMLLTSQTQAPTGTAGVKPSAEIRSALPTAATKPVSPPVVASASIGVSGSVKPADTTATVNASAATTNTPAKPAEIARSVAKPPAAKPAAAIESPIESVSAQANPYKPPVAVARPSTEAAKPTLAAPTAAPQPSTGTTTYFGPTPAAVDTTAKINPDYKPASAATPSNVDVAVKAADATSSAVAPAQPTIVVQPPPEKGTTTFFGVTPTLAEAPAKANPDYKPTNTAAIAEAPDASRPTPATAAPAPAATPVASLAAQALSAVTSLITPAPARQTGVTSYYGPTPPMPEAAARPNPDYIPSTAGTTTAALAPPATLPAATPSPAIAFTGTPAGAAKAGSDASPAGLCRASLAKAMKGGRVAFQSAKADLRNSSAAVLDRIAETIKACPGVRVTIEGHTDNTGQPDMNQKLSLARAQTVAGYLAARGVDAARVSPVGIGSARPVAPNTTAINKARNRRIEFQINNS